MQHEQVRLANGLETLFIHAPGLTSASVQIWFRAGSSFESASEYGIAHFLEHMFFRGTKKRPGSKIAYDVESYGGEINAFTSFDYTCYYINSPLIKLEQTLQILLDMVSSPLFRVNDIVPEREVVFEEYRRSLDSPSQYSFQRLQKQCFLGGYKHPILGNEKTIKKFSQKQLRDFRQRYYNLSNALLVVGGDLSQKNKLIKVIEKFKLPKGPEAKSKALVINKKTSIDVFSKDVKMAQLNIVIQASDFLSENAPSEDLTMGCLGMGETSKLYQALVLNQTMANHASASTLFMNRGGAHMIRVSFPLENRDKVYKELLKALTQAAEKGFTEQDVKKIKMQYTASKLYDLESIEARAFSLGHGFAQNNDINADEVFINKVNKVSLTKVNHALTDIFSRPFHLSLQTPLKTDLAKEKKKLEIFQKGLQKIGKGKKIKDISPSIKTSRYDSALKVVELRPGIQLIHRQNEMTPTFVMNIALRGGLSEENDKNNGIYHLLCALLTKGFPEMPYEKLQRELEEKSAQFSGYSGKNAYGLNIHGQTEHFKDLSSILFSSLQNPDLPEVFLTHEKEITKRNLENQKKDPVRTCFNRVSEMMFNGHPYAKSVLGTEKTLKLINRDEIKKTHQENLKNGHMVITYCGDLSLEEVVQEIEVKIKSLSPRKTSPLRPKKYRPQSIEREHIPFDREQTQIFFATPTGKLTDPDQLILKILTAHLSGQSSELFVEVRDKQGLCYTAQPIHFMALEGGYWGIYMASGHDKVDLACQAIKKLIDKIAEKGLTKNQFDRIKNMIRGQALINVQTNEDYANIYSIPTLQGQGYDFYHHSNIEIDKLTHARFQKEIKKILKKPWNTLTVGR